MTLPAVSPETLEATFALPSCAASLAPPPPPDWPWTAPAVELIVPWTLPEVALTAAVPWLAKSEPVCVASVARLVDRASSSCSSRRRATS